MAFLEYVQASAKRSAATGLTPAATIKEARRRGRQKGERPVWTDRRIASLNACFAAGTDPEDMASRFGCSVGAIQAAKLRYCRKYVKTSGPRKPRWTFELEGALLQYRELGGLSYSAITKKPEFRGFSKGALIGKHHRIMAAHEKAKQERSRRMVQQT